MVLKILHLYCEIPDIIGLGVEKEILRKVNLIKVKQNNKKFLSRYARSTFEIKMESFNQFLVRIVDGINALGNSYIDNVTLCEVLGTLKSKLRVRKIVFYLKQDSYKRMQKVLLMMSNYEDSNGNFAFGGFTVSKAIHGEDTNFNFIGFEPESERIGIQVVDPLTKRPEVTSIYVDTSIIWNMIHKLVRT